MGDFFGTRYGRNSRIYLTDKELVDFRNYFKKITVIGQFVLFVRYKNSAIAFFDKTNYKTTSIDIENSSRVQSKLVRYTLTNVIRTIQLSWV